mmetsp:Transcript_34277/g.80835  ORF Transcript_34277/g.80835 Transcript_34277/m.80835 type:complete len:367 (+) Transcript_34277:2421-3521(+)
MPCGEDPDHALQNLVRSLDTRTLPSCVWVGGLDPVQDARAVALEQVEHLRLAEAEGGVRWSIMSALRVLLAVLLLLLLLLLLDRAIPGLHVEPVVVGQVDLAREHRLRRAIVHNPAAFLARAGLEIPAEVLAVDVRHVRDHNTRFRHAVRAEQLQAPAFEHPVGFGAQRFLHLLPRRPHLLDPLLIPWLLLVSAQAPYKGGPAPPTCHLFAPRHFLAPAAVLYHEGRVLCYARDQPHHVEDHVRRRRTVRARVQVESAGEHAVQRAQQRPWAVDKLVGEEATWGRSVVAPRRRDHLDVRLGLGVLPQAWLEEARIEHVLKVLRIEQVKASLVAEELQYQRDTQVRHREVLDQQLRLAGADAAVEVR